MKYTKPVTEMEKFHAMDVITTSGGGSGDGKIETEDEELA